MQFVGESFWEYIWLVINKNIKNSQVFVSYSNIIDYI